MLTSKDEGIKVGIAIWGWDMHLGFDKG